MFYTTAERERRFRVITLKVPIAPDATTWAASINMEPLVQVLAQKSLMEGKTKLDIKHSGYYILSFVRNFISYLRYGINTYVIYHLTNRV